jgi:hypothetical protein
MWELESKIKANPCSINEKFGYDVSISGNLIVAGAPTNNESGSGAIYIFRFDGDSWIQEARMTADDGLAGHEFGHSVDTDGTYVVSSAWFDNHAQIKSGSAWVFHKISNQWQPQIKLIASDAAAFDRFGTSVAIATGRIAVSAYTEDPNGITNAGSVYIFDNVEGTWSEKTKLYASDAGEYDEYGWKIAINEEGDMIAVGSIRYEDPEFDLMYDQGAVYLYRNIDQSWEEIQQLTRSNHNEWDLFGGGVALSCDSLSVGISRDDSSQLDAGSALIYRYLTQESNCVGDLNNDGFINIDDLLQLVANWGSPGPIGDINYDCNVDVKDLLILIQGWGTCP